jgi:hypothetical protein
MSNHPSAKASKHTAVAASQVRIALLKLQQQTLEHWTLSHIVGTLAAFERWNKAPTARGRLEAGTWVTLPTGHIGDTGPIDMG